ncbi:unnamed protein product [Caenorhabditis bovis]|uniref:Uncharacterized protein n=1 Tax=Caenorhabditis bovis TaxID=2654633 RepID=A0A8S1EN48_9PELO|nr:unnamed protein product [Caenorhabditis bovis]
MNTEYTLKDKLGLNFNFSESTKSQSYINMRGGHYHTFLTMKSIIVLFCIIAVGFARPGGYGRPAFGPEISPIGGGFQQGGFASQSFTQGSSISSGGFGGGIPPGPGFGGGSYYGKR